MKQVFKSIYVIIQKQLVKQTPKQTPIQQLTTNHIEGLKRLKPVRVHSFTTKHHIFLVTTIKNTKPISANAGESFLYLVKEALFMPFDIRREEHFNISYSCFYGLFHSEYRIIFGVKLSYRT